MVTNQLMFEDVLNNTIRFDEEIRRKIKHRKTIPIKAAKGMLESDHHDNISYMEMSMAELEEAIK